MGEADGSGGLDGAQLAEHIATESALFAAALADADPAARVPTCPDWDAADLAWHLTEVHHFLAVIVRDRLADPGPADDAKPDRPTDLAGILTLYARTTAELLDALAGATDDEPIWTWAADRSVGFARRFQAHEALMHRIDAELTAGRTPAPMPDDLAADGIDVALTHCFGWRPPWSTVENTRVAAVLRATDSGRSWTARHSTWSGHSPDSGKDYADEGNLVLVDGTVLADPAALIDGTGPASTVTIAGTTAAVNGWVWNRPVFGDVTLEGDRRAADAVLAVVRAGIS